MEIDPSILEAEADRMDAAFAGLAAMPLPSRRWGLPAPEPKPVVEELLVVTNDAIPMEALRLADWSAFDDEIVAETALPENLGDLEMQQE